MTQTEYPILFRPLECNADGKTAKVSTGLQEFKLKAGSCGNYGGYGWHIANWPIEMILSKKQRENVKQAKKLIEAGKLEEFKNKYRVADIPALVAFYAEQQTKAKRLRPKLQ